MSQADDTLGMLLSMDDGRPYLDALPASSTREGELQREIEKKIYSDPTGDPNDLAAQGWSVIAPEGSAGDRLLEIVRPLLAKRAEDQGLEVGELRVFRVPTDGSCRSHEGAASWSRTRYDNLRGTAEGVPLYQLILGDLDQVPLAIQQRQSLGGHVGRLHFDDERGYEAYVAKVLKWERAPQKTPGRLLLHTAHDGSGALRSGLDGLVQPLVSLFHEERDRGRSSAGTITAGGGVPLEPDLDGFFDRTEERDVGVLFSMSHGLGGPRDGWKREQDRHARQGAMTFGLDGIVTGNDLANRPFMPGGVWFMFACYGAGTPDVSAYQHWLSRLASLGKMKELEVISSLKGERPFVAALPQRVLANPEGPLAFIGHVDLAWSYSFHDADDATRRRPGQFHRILDPILRAGRVGIAVHQLTREQEKVETDLLGYYDEDARLQKATGDEAKRAFLWMQRNDLAGYILLGDPAARLPVTPPSRKGGRPAPPSGDDPKAARAKGPASGAASFSAPASFASEEPPPMRPAPSANLVPAGVDPEKLERAICDLIVGERTTKKIAAEARVDPADLVRLAEIYRAAGRAALGIKR